MHGPRHRHVRHSIVQARPTCQAATRRITASSGPPREPPGPQPRCPRGQHQAHAASVTEVADSWPSGRWKKPASQPVLSAGTAMARRKLTSTCCNCLRWAAKALAKAGLRALSATTSAASVAHSGRRHSAGKSCGEHQDLRACPIGRRQTLKHRGQFFVFVQRHREDDASLPGTWLWRLPRLTPAACAMPRMLAWCNPWHGSTAAPPAGSGPRAAHCGRFGSPRK